MSDDIEIQNLQGQIDQLRSMIPLMGGEGNDGGAGMTMNGTGFDFSSSSNTDTKDDQEFTFRSANDSNVVVRLSTMDVTVGQDTVTKTIITIGVYYV